MRTWMIFAAMLLISIMGVSAANETSNATRFNLEARYGHNICKTDLLVAQADLLNGYIEGFDATNDIADIKEKMVQLEEISNTGDVEAFDLFIKNEIAPKVAALQSKVKFGLRDYTSGKLDKEKKAELKLAWKENLLEYGKCNSGSKKEIVGERLKEIKSGRDNWGKAISEMKKGGFDVAGLEEISQDADLLEKMYADALASETDEEFREKLNEARQAHLHVWARFHISKVDSFIEKLRPYAESQGFAEELDRIFASLDTARANAQVGHEYAQGELEETWGLIKSAEKDLNELKKDLKPMKKAEIEQKKAEVKAKVAQKKAEIEQRKAEVKAKIAERKGQPNKAGGKNE